jgi:hypothetical protein
MTQAPPARQLTHCVFLAYKSLGATAPSCRVWLDGARAVSRTAGPVPQLHPFARCTLAMVACVTRLLVCSRLWSCPVRHWLPNSPHAQREVYNPKAEARLQAAAGGGRHPAQAGITLHRKHEQPAGEGRGAAAGQACCACQVAGASMRREVDRAGSGCQWCLSALRWLRFWQACTLRAAMGRWAEGPRRKGTPFICGLMTAAPHRWQSWRCVWRLCMQAGCRLLESLA